MEVNGKDDLNMPLLKSSDDFVVDIPQPTNNKERKIRTVKFKIGEIKCASCSTTVESLLQKLDGIENAVVSPLQGLAAINYIPELIKVKKIREAIEEAGFPVDEFPEQDISVCRLRIKGMACTSCSESIERALQMIDGVKTAVVGLALEEAKVHFDPNLTDTDCIIEAIEDAGFGAEFISSENDANKVHLTVEGVNSPEDLTIIRSSLESVVGVTHVEMNLEENKITVAYDPDLTGPRSLINCIKEAGNGSKSYNASFFVAPIRREAEQQQEIRIYRDQFFLSCIFSVPVFVFSMLLPMLPPYGNWLDYKIHNMLTIGILLRWILCTPVQFIIVGRVKSFHTSTCTWLYQKQ